MLSLTLSQMHLMKDQEMAAKMQQQAVINKTNGNIIHYHNFLNIGFLEDGIQSGYVKGLSYGLELGFYEACAASGLVESEDTVDTKGKFAITYVRSEYLLLIFLYLCH